MTAEVLDAAPPGRRRTPAKRKARELAKHLRGERPDYAYLKEVFRHLRAFYTEVWRGGHSGDIVLIRTFMYTGVRVAELAAIRLTDVDLDHCRIRINDGKGGKDRYVPFPPAFAMVLKVHIDGQRAKGAVYLFESSWKRPYSDRGVRKILARYCAKAGIQQSISPHKLRHFLFTWLKTQGVDDAHIQPYSGHATRQSLEVYSLVSLATAQASYDAVIDKFPV